MNGEAATHATMITTIVAAKTVKPTQLLSFLAAYMWLRLRSSPVVTTKATWLTTNTRNQSITRKCSDRAAWMLRSLLRRRNRVDNAGDMPSPVISASGAAMKIVTK